MTDHANDHVNDHANDRDRLAGLDRADDRLRATFQSQLRAEEARVANGVVGPHLSPSGTRRSTSRSFVRPLLAVAAVLAVAGAGIGIALSRQDGGQRLETAVDGVTTTTVDDDPATTIDDVTTTTVDGDDGGAGTSGGPATDDQPVGETPVPDPEAGYTRAGGWAVVQFGDERATSTWAAVDLATGEVGPVFHQDGLEATWFSPVELAPTGDAIYLTQGFEDYWYSCESFVPDLFRLPLEPDAEREQIGQGAEPRVSPDGTRLAYLASSDCVPDPENPDSWVVAPLDTIVVRDLATGAEIRHTVPGMVEAITAGADYREADLRGLVWLGDDRLGVSDGDILAAADLTPTGDRLPVLIESGSAGRSVGYDPATGSVLVELSVYDDDAPSYSVVAVDVATGDRATVWTWTAASFRASSPAGTDGAGRLIVATPEGLTLPDGTVVPLSTLPDSAQPISVDW